MGVDFYNCKHCNKIFNDCGAVYISCECGETWCSEECAQGDKYTIPIDEDGEEKIDFASCSFCRSEDVCDKDLFEFSLKKFKTTRDEVLKIFVLQNKKKV